MDRILQLLGGFGIRLFDHLTHFCDPAVGILDIECATLFRIEGQRKMQGFTGEFDRIECVTGEALGCHHVGDWEGKAHHNQAEGEGQRDAPLGGRT